MSKTRIFKIELKKKVAKTHPDYYVGKMLKKQEKVM
tara:strand:- start:6882 stop:6989 length:108 start_codon:yes stop_codon:yes gene_type:complete